MKYFLILFVFMLTCAASVAYGTNTAYGMSLPIFLEELLGQSQTVFVGTITAVEVLEFESPTNNTRNDFSSKHQSKQDEEGWSPKTIDKYTVSVEEFLKNPQESDTISVLQATRSSGVGVILPVTKFEVGDRVLFFIPKLDGDKSMKML